jgi:hypothetical protein
MLVWLRGDHGPVLKVRRSANITPDTNRRSSAEVRIRWAEPPLKLRRNFPVAGSALQRTTDWPTPTEVA